MAAKRTQIIIPPPPRCWCEYAVCSFSKHEAVLYGPTSLLWSHLAIVLEVFCFVQICYRIHFRMKMLSPRVLSNNQSVFFWDIHSWKDWMLSICDLIFLSVQMV
ncbi:hypothetical protein ILYODFUR_015394 [Ilyodon furcidens]|uniref:Uncharacterized protein n=1 Tax=Ilyodon furcidens TaxID=33524 RepID=A0ABV0T8M7_9TELE